METIYEYKELLRKIKREILIKSNALENNSQYSKIFLISVEEDIALWRKGYYYTSLFKEDTNLKDCYFYTDLKGNLLFDGKTFRYATAFSNSRACVCDYNNEWMILDLEKREMISFPCDLTFGNINNFKNDHLALFDKNSSHWGSIKYNSEEKFFAYDIPFIWDALEFSREKEEVYVGTHTVTAIQDNHPYFHWSDDFGIMFTIGAMRMPIKSAKDLDCYNRRIKVYEKVPYQNIIKYIQEKICEDVPEEERNHLVQEYLKTAYDISDAYFKEEYKEEFNNNNNIGQIVDVGNIKDYQRKLGRFIK